MKSRNHLRDSELLRNLLKDAGLVCDSPESQPNLLPFEKNEIPKDKVEAINRYDYRAKLVFCHACGKYNHFRGLTVKFDSCLALIGNCCAEKYFGQNAYNVLERKLQRKEEFIYYTNYIEPVEKRVLLAIEEIEKLEHICGQIDHALDTLLSKAQPLLSKLVDAVRQDGSRLIDYKEATNYSTLETGRGRKIQYVAEIVGHVRGGRVLLKTQRLYKLWGILRANLYGIKKQISLNPSTLNELKEISMSFQTCRSRASDLVELIFEGCQFLSHENLVVVSAYNQKAGIAGNWDGFGGGRAFAIERIVPTGFEIPGTKLMEAF
jgi:hypothetical protein